jgi:hypothetical protein
LISLNTVAVAACVHIWRKGFKPAAAAEDTALYDERAFRSAALKEYEITDNTSYNGTATSSAR